MSDISGLHLSGEFARRLKYQPVIKHLDLYFRTLDVVGSVAACVDRHLLNDEFRIITLCYELSMLAQERMLTNLSLDKLNRLLDLVQDGSLKCNILDDIHLCAHLLVNTFVSNKASAGPGEELLGILAKEKNASSAHILFTILVGPHKTIVLSQSQDSSIPQSISLCQGVRRGL